MGGNRKDWNRYLLEGGTICFSILLALFMDASWEQYQETRREREYLDGLHSEFAESRRELASDQQRRRQIEQLAIQLLDPETGDPSPRITAAELAVVTDYRFYTPSHSVLEDLISSGSLNLIESRALRLALMDYVQERDRVQVAETREREFVARQFEPWLVKRLPLNRVMRDRDGGGPPIEGLIGDPEFESLLWLRLRRTQTSLRFAEYLEEVIEEIIGEIESARG